MILKGKKKKALSNGQNAEDITEESVLEDEKSKLKDLPEDHMAIQTFVGEL